MSSPPAARSAARITATSHTGLPSSEKATAPARASASKSVSRSPRRPWVTAASWRTRTRAPRRQASWTDSRTSTVSTTGSVLAMAHTVVKPPAAAAAVPDSIVSFSGNPGVRRWVWMSTRPGVTTRPRASRTTAPAGAVSAPATRAAIRPSCTSRSPGDSKRSEGSTIRPPLMSSGESLLLAGQGPLAVVRLLHAQLLQLAPPRARHVNFLPGRVPSCRHPGRLRARGTKKGPPHKASPHMHGTTKRRTSDAVSPPVRPSLRALLGQRADTELPQRRRSTRRAHVLFMEHHARPADTTAWRLKGRGSFGAYHVEAGAAVDRTIVARQERDLRLDSTAVAHRGKELSRAARSAKPLLTSGARRRPARRTATVLVH